jgi:hypothetical protein
MEVTGQLHAPAALPKGRSPHYPIYEAGWVSEQRNEGEKHCHYRASNSDPSAAQPIASSYTDCAIPAPSHTEITVFTQMRYLYT